MKKEEILDGSTMPTQQSEIMKKIDVVEKLTKLRVALRKLREGLLNLRVALRMSSIHI